MRPFHIAVLLLLSVPREIAPGQTFGSGVCEVPFRFGEWEGMPGARLLLVDGRVGAMPLTLILDTGAAHTLVDSRAVWNKARGRLSLGCWSETRWLGAMDTSSFRIQGERIGGLLGQDVLSQFSRVTIDYEAHQLVLVGGGK